LLCHLPGFRVVHEQQRAQLSQAEGKTLLGRRQIGVILSGWTSIQFASAISADPVRPAPPVATSA
jgi:hypothetical protein